MPSLISNYRKKVYVTQLKKSVNVLSNGFRQILADEEVDSLNDSSFFTVVSNGTRESYDLNSSILPKYFKIIKMDVNGDVENSQYKSLAGYIAYAHQIGGCYSSQCVRMTLVDGTDVFMRNKNNDTIETLIDINGYDRLPNTVGLDVFSALFNAQGMLHIHHSTIHQNSDQLKSHCYGAIYSYPRASSCLQSVVNNNWEITYY